MTMNRTQVWTIGIAVFWLTSLVVSAEPPEKTMAQGQRLAQQGHWEQAIVCYRQVLAMTPEHPSALYYLGVALVKSGEIEEGFAALERAIALKPSGGWHLMVAQLSDEHERGDQAITHYEASLKYRQNATVCFKLADAYTDKKDFTKASHYRSQGIANETALIRKLNFKKIVTLGIKSRNELKQFLTHELDKEIPPEKAAVIDLTLRAFGFFKESLDIRAIMLKLLTEQVAGFYDPETKQLYLIGESSPNTESFNLANAQERMTIAHEMTHALQDQYFDLLALEKRVKNNDDRSLAYQALVEGDATLTMFDYQLKPKYYTSAHAPLLRIIFALEQLLTPFVGGEALATVPAVIRENLIFPYVEGLFFCLALRGETADNAKINKAFRHLPTSTEQILHPEKYLAGEQPQELVLADLSGILGSEWKQAENNVMGEFFIRMLFSEFQSPVASKIAAGWGGDRYAILQDAAGRYVLVWLTAWDTESDAQEFFTGYEQVLQKKFSTASLEKQERQITLTQNGEACRMVLDKTTVVIVERVPTTKLETLWSKVRNAK